MSKVGVIMKLKLNRYLQSIREHLGMDPISEREVIRELADHVEDSCQEMQKAGFSEEEALEKSITLLGPAKIVAKQIYEAHNRGTWRQALLAAMPHLFFAAMFALKIWGGTSGLLIIFGVIAGIGLYGWCHGKPYWLFPWLSYSLFPVVAAGISLLYLPAVWAWITLALYVPLALWLLSFIAIKFIKRDWSYSALMLLPAIAFAGWFLAAGQKTSFFGLKINSMHDHAPWTSLTFIVLAISAALFIRLPHRWLRITALIISGLLITLVTTLVSNELGLVSFIGLALLLLSFLLVPAFVERRVRERNLSGNLDNKDFSQQQF
jgi:hypothetical protein